MYVSILSRILRVVQNGLVCVSITCVHFMGVFDLSCTSVRVFTSVGVRSGSVYVRGCVRVRVWLCVSVRKCAYVSPCVSEYNEFRRCVDQNSECEDGVIRVVSYFCV